MERFYHSVCFMLLVSSFGESTRGRLSVYNVTCDPIVQDDCQAESLESVANDVIEGMEVEINIQLSELHLNSTLTFANLNSLSINVNLTRNRMSFVWTHNTVATVWVY